MNVLSLFDGKSCGRVALDRLGIKVDNYFSSEIDKYAIQVSEDNYPDIIRLGDITKWREWDLPKIDLILGGSPCQGFSLSGKLLNFEDPRSKLYFDFEKILKTYNPDAFLLENVKMAKKHSDVITERLAVEPILINSALVSAQNRERLYWTNIPNLQQPLDKGIELPSGMIGGAVRGRYDEQGKTYQKLELRKDRKSNCLTTVDKDSICIVDGVKRSYSREEKEWLQTLPIGYTDSVSTAQASKMLGNGWTVDVITHILKGLKGEKIK